MNTSSSHPNHPHIAEQSKALPTELRPAGLGTRSAAGLVDTSIAFFLPLTFLMAPAFSLTDSTRAIIAAAMFTVLFVGIPIFFELRSQGQTPGKRLFGIRVISVDAKPASPSQIVIRNVVRLVDFLPAMYTVGLSMTFWTKRSQRLGDRIAGTLVINESPVTTKVAEHEVSGIPRKFLDACVQLIDRKATLDPDIFEVRRSELITQARTLRIDWKDDPDERIWNALGNNL